MPDSSTHPDITKARFALSRATGDADYKGDGLRPFAVYRDLGFGPASDGAVHAHIVRMIPPCTDAVRERHRHLVQFQMFYVLKGWIKIEFEGQGELHLKEGDACMMPGGIKHTVLDYSDDLHNLEIVMPAEFDTVKA